MSSGGAHYAAVIASAERAQRTARDPITATLRSERLADAPTGPVPAGRRGLHRGVRVPWTGFPASRVVFWVGAVLVAALAVALRAYHQLSAYEAFVDEIEYTNIANSFARGDGPREFGDLFFLHPSLPFYLLGLTIPNPVPTITGTVEQMLALRPHMLVFGALNSLLVIGIARRVVGPGAALLAGLVYALDPFIVRFDSRVMLEAPMMAAVLGGVLAALVAVDRTDRRARWGWLAVAGVAFGVAICTKSTSALITSGPLLLMAVTSWGLRRREALATFAIQCSCYLVYLGWIVAGGYWGPWFEATVAGSFRAVGVVKETGYTSGNAPPFVPRLIAQIGLFGASYVLIGVGVCYSVYLLAIGWRSLRVDRPGGTHALRGDGDDLGLLTCWLAGVLVAIVYTAGFGEVEEQTFYLLTVPSAVVVAMLVTQMASWRSAARTALTVVVTLVLTAAGGAWWAVHSQPDDTYRQLSAFVYSRVDPGDKLALGEETAQFVLPGYEVARFASLDDARACGCRYGLVSTQLTANGLAPAEQPLLDELARRYTPVFVARGRSMGDMILYDLNRPRDGAAPIAP